MGRFRRFLRAMRGVPTSRYDGQEESHDPINLAENNSERSPMLSAEGPYETFDLSAHEIRILTLLPGDFNDLDIHCRIQVCSLKDARSDSRGNQNGYEALSYTWGTSKKRTTIYLNGKSFAVTTNLYHALRYLRHPSETRRLWIDAICINQSNVLERNRQVRKMRNIYAGASRVVIWLGKSNQDIDSAFDYCSEFDANGNEQGVSLPDRMNCDSVLRGMEQISLNPWWTRVWVVQEVIVPKSEPIFLCGRKHMSWAGFKSARIHLAVTGKIRDRSMKKVAPTLTKMDLFSLIEFYAQRSYYQEKSTDHKTNLDGLLIRTADRQAHDPRDHVFALLGLVPQLERNIIADYHMEVQDVYQQAMLNSFQTSGDTELLIQATGSKNLELPSWCVDFSKVGWNKRSSELFQFYSFGHGDPSFNPGLALQGQPAHHPKLGELIIPGKLIGRVLYALPLPKSGSARPPRALSIEKNPSKKLDFEAWISLVAEFRSQMYEVLHVRKSQDQVLEVMNSGEVWKIAAAGQPFNHAVSHFEEKAPKDGEKWDFRTVERYLTTLSERSGLTGTDVTSTVPTEMEMAAMTWAYNLFLRSSDCALFVTDTAYAGRAAHPIREGDVLCMLYGCSRPLVLRKSHRDAYNLVTYTYTHDVKQDDKSIAEDIKRLETQEIHLR